MQKWFPEVLEEFKIYSVFDLLLEYLENDRIKVNPELHTSLTTYHDPCNYGRKSLKTFGHGYFEEGRIITRACCPDFVDMVPKGNSNYCCGAGGGVKEAYPDFNSFTAKERVEEARATGAEALVTACPWCERNFLDAISDTGARMKVYDIIELVQMAI